MRISFALLIIFFIGSSTEIQGQKTKITYEIIHSSNSIGELNATMVTIDKKIIYTDRTSIIAHIFTKIELDYTYESVYNDGVLDHNNVTIMLNGQVRTKTSTKKDGSGYLFYRDDQLKNNIKQSIPFSSIRLLFEEPLGVSLVYAEEHGVFHTLKKIREHVYLKTTPEGHENTYYYKNGLLQEAKIHAGIVNFSMRRKR